MLNSKLERFIAKRAVVVCLILMMVAGIFIEQRIPVLSGLLVGTIFGILRLSSMASTFSRLLPESKKKITPGYSVVKYALSQLAALIVLVVALMYNVWLFAGIAAGILSVPLVIVINSVTEYFGLSQNHFE